MYKTVFDLATGEHEQILLTDEEIADLQSIPQPVRLPRSIDARRLRLALLQLNLLDKVESAIATLGKAAQIDWEYATEIKEDYPLVLALANNLGLDTEAIFTLAISLD
jgi:hypothetical protein